MLSNDIAIVGIDSKFAGLADIDHVARALYTGRNTCFDHQDSALRGSKHSASCNDAHCAENCADDKANQASSNEPCLVELNRVIHDSSLMMLNEQVLPLSIIVINNQSLELKKHLLVPEHSKNLEVVTELSEALSIAVAHINAGNCVALVGINFRKITTNQINNTISFDHTFVNYTSTAGYASMLLASQSQALKGNLPIYGYINACGVSSVNADTMKQAVLESLQKSNEKQLGFVEVSAPTDNDDCELEASVLIEAYSSSPLTSQPLTHAISCVKSIIGDSGGFSQVLGLLRAVIALQQRYIPGIHDWQTPKAEQLSLWQSSSFYFPTESRPWYPNIDGSKHSAAYSCLTANSYCHIVLTEHTVEVNDIRINGHLASSELKLVLISGNDEAELQQQLTEISAATTTTNLKTITDQQYQHYLSSSAKPYRLVLLADSLAALMKEILLAQAGVAQVFVNLAKTSTEPKPKPKPIAKLKPKLKSKLKPELKQALTNKHQSPSTEWKTPQGSYFTAQPVADLNSINSDKQNGVCFMYPGIGATYLGLGRDILQLFPEIYPDLVNLADDIGSSLKDSLLNPRSISRLNFNELKQRELALRGNLADIAEAGVAFACVFTKVFTNIFNVKADFATGYSMGEVSMYAALGCWQTPSLLSQRLAKSATFNEKLSGNLLTLREQWSIGLKGKSPTPLWETYTVRATLAEVEAACVGETRVYCTIINTADSLLIAGYPQDCLRVIEKLGVRSLPLNMANAIHSEPAKAEYNAMVSLYTMAVNERINTKMYSSSCYLPIPQLSKAIANSIAKCLCDRVDFPRLVNALYDNGARVFIEMGPGRSLSSWVDKTLESKASNNLTVAVNAKGVSDELTYFRAVAKLVSHGVKLDLKRFFYGSIIINKQ